MELSPPRLRRLWLHALLWPLALPLLTMLVAATPLAQFGHDYIQFWAAGKILLAGENPYDPELQAAANTAAGWKIDEHGLGHFRYLPYYYPPWLALALSPMLLLGYTLARHAWVALLIECIAASAWLLRRYADSLSASISMLLVAGLGVWWTTIRFGQVAPLVLLLLAIGWRLLESRRDLAAGLVLACLTIKPQLAALPMLAVLLWSARQGRWSVLTGCAAGMTLIVVVTSAVMPGWLPAMLAAPRETPLVIAERPWMGATWYSLSATLGLEGTPHRAAWLLLATAALAWVAVTAWDRRSPLTEVLAVAALGAPIVAPYLRYYDLPILLLPLLWLLGTRLSETIKALLIAVFLIVPVLLFLRAPDELPPSFVQGQWLWMVAALTTAWAIERWQAGRNAVPRLCEPCEAH